MRVIVSGDEEPSVSIGPFVSEMDEAEREREKHETRRLLYVALTRARDRLYLSSALKDGALAPGRGSLAEVLPHIDQGRCSPRRLGVSRMPGGRVDQLIRRPFEWRLCRSRLATTPSQLPARPRRPGRESAIRVSDRCRPASPGAMSAQDRDGPTGRRLGRRAGGGADRHADPSAFRSSRNAGGSRRLRGAADAGVRGLLLARSSSALVDPDACARSAV